MTDNVAKQNQAVLWYQEDGPFTPFAPLGIGETSATGKSRPGAGKEAVYGSNRFGRPVVLFTQLTPPGGLDEMTVGLYDKATVSYLQQRQLDGQDIYMQVRISMCGTLDNPALWDSIDHGGKGLVTDITPGDGPVTPFAGDVMSEEGTVVFDYSYRIIRTNLSGLNSGLAANLNAVAVMSDAIQDCGAGYPGPDKLIFIAADAVAAAVPNVLISRNGGGIFNSVASAFAVSENIGHIAIDWIDFSRLRSIISNITSNAGNASIAYADHELGDEANTTYTNVVSTASDAQVGEIVTGLAWLFPTGIYIATDGGLVYKLSDVTDWSEDAIADVGVNITCFARNFAGDRVYAAGATNAIFQETDRNGVLVTRVGPSGGGAFTAIEVFNDGTIVAGNGTSLFKSSNGALNAGGWELLRNFGAGYTVRKILKTGGEKSRGGDTQIYRVVVDHATDAGVWETVDGGATYRRIANLPSLGYNDAAGSNSNNNWAVIVGNIDAGGNGAIHLLSK